MVNCIKSIYCISLCLGLLLCVAQGFKFLCRNYLDLCDLKNWNPIVEGFFVLGHVPRVVKTLKLTNLETDSINGEFLYEVGRTLKGVVLDNANAVKTLLVPQNSSLQLIQISGSKIKSIDFQPNTFLVKLVINRHQVDQIPPSMMNLSKLRRLILINGHITYLNLSTFYGMRNLIELNLLANQIKLLNSPVAPSNTSYKTALKYFRLRDNKLQTIDLDLLHPFPMLAVVDIAKNKITSISGTLSTASRLGWMMVKYNRLRLLDFCEWNVIRSNFTLLASYNRLIRVPSCLTNFPNAVVIELSYNMIMYADMNDFVGMNSLREIDLKGNKMMSLEFGSDVMFPKLYYIRLQDNCMCKLNISEATMARMPLLEIRFTEFNDSTCIEKCVNKRIGH